MELIQRIIKFGLVGTFGMFLDFFITWLCKEKLRFNKYIANSLGFSIAVVSNFFLNLRWTFQAAGTNTASYFIRFAIFSLIGLGLNNLCVFLFTDKLGINFYLSKVMAILCVFIWNFSANNYLNFHA
jgi:putative flippase GtrA